MQSVAAKDEAEELSEVRSVRTSAGWANENKVVKAQHVNAFVLELKNKMSVYIKNNFTDLIDDYDEFIRNYSKFNNQLLTAWETQTIFHDICKAYKNILGQLQQNSDTSIQKSIKKEYYKRNVKDKGGNIIHAIGDVKSYKITKQKTELTKIVKLFSMLDLDLLEKYEYYEDNSFYRMIIAPWMRHKHWLSIWRLAKQIQNHIKWKMPTANFTTGTYRVNLKGNEFIKDETNKEFKYFFSYKGSHYPLQLNEKKYHRYMSQIKTGKNKQVFVKVIDDRVDFIFVRDKKVEFMEFTKMIALDVNIKHNFCTSNEGDTFDYDRKYIKEFIAEIRKIDAIGYRNLNAAQKKELERIIKKNEYYFKQRIGEILKIYSERGYSDIVLENLTKFDMGAFDAKNKEFLMSYTRLTRLLRVGKIKDWFRSQGEKYGIRVHFTVAEYSSQKCADCHHIDRDNRPTQEEFKCVDCGHEDEADFNSPKNLYSNIAVDVLRNALHTFDEYGRANPKKKISKETIKKALSSLQGNIAKRTSSMAMPDFRFSASS